MSLCQCDTQTGSKITEPYFSIHFTDPITDFWASLCIYKRFVAACFHLQVSSGWQDVAPQWRLVRQSQHWVNVTSQYVTRSHINTFSPKFQIPNDCIIMTWCEFSFPFTSTSDCRIVERLHDLRSTIRKGDELSVHVVIIVHPGISLNNWESP
jgi:hypothetical protein